MEYNGITYTKVREHVWQIKEEGVYCTLVKGEDFAILWDTGYGKKDIRGFVEANCNTPYVVINSHGHPDHCLGNSAFTEVYAPKEEWDIIRHYTKEETGKDPQYTLKDVRPGTRLDLGGIHAVIIPMEGHTKSSIGLLLIEDRLLLSGDAINDYLWMFNYGSLYLDQLYAMLERLEKEPFDTFVEGHYEKEMDKSIIQAHKKNLENLVLDLSTEKFLLGDQVYESVYEGKEGTSHIIYEKELLSPKQRMKNRMTTIYFVRHAQPVREVTDRIRPLTEEGEKDRHKVTEVLQDMILDYAVCSPYTRSLDTIRECAAAHGLEIHTDERFRERESGANGNTYQLLQKRWEDKDFHEEGGESIHMVQQRNMDGLMELLKTHEGERILFGTHGTALSTILNHYDSSFGIDGFLQIVDWMPYVIRLTFIGTDCIDKQELLHVEKEHKGNYRIMR